MAAQQQQQGQGMFELVMARHSVKSFDGKPLSAEEVSRIQAFIADADSLAVPGFAAPGANKGLFRFVWIAENVCTGLIRSPSGCIVALRSRAKAADHNLELCMSYAFERVHVALLTPMHLDACWISLTLDKDKAAAAAHAGADEEVVFAFPVGRKAPTLLSRGAAFVTGMGTRKPLATFVCNGDLGCPFEGLTESDPWWKVFESVRWAPSAYNKQPARIVVGSTESPRERVFHLFLSNAVPQYLWQDAGIALWHFDSVATELGHTGTWATSDVPGVPNAGSAFVYIASFVPSAAAQK